MKSSIARDELETKSQALKLEAEIAWNARNEEILSFFNKLIKDNKLENNVSFRDNADNAFDYQLEIYQSFEFSISASDDNDVWSALYLYFNGNEFIISPSSGPYVHFSNECYIAFAKLNSALVEYSNKIKSLEKSICSYNSIINAYWDSMREIDEFDKTHCLEKDSKEINALSEQDSFDLIKLG